MTLTIDTRYTQFGCGLCAPGRWLNFDASPMLRLQKLPLIGKYMPSGPFGRFPLNVEYGDIVKGLPIPDHSVELLYCSHVLEHLSLSELRTALQNCYRVLQPKGIFRLVVPDLEFMARHYVNSTAVEAALEFMEETCLGKKERQRDLAQFLKDWLGGSHHLWMWDYKSLACELDRVGFVEIQQAFYGRSGIALFDQVEDPERWEKALGIQCRK